MKLSQNVNKVIMMLTLLMVVICAGCSSKPKPIGVDPLPAIETDSNEIAPGSM